MSPQPGQIIKSVANPGAGYSRVGAGQYKYVGVPGAAPGAPPTPAAPVPGTPPPAAAPPRAAPKPGQVINSVTNPGADYTRVGPGQYRYTGSGAAAPTPGAPAAPAAPVAPAAPEAPPPVVPNFGGTPQPSPYEGQRPYDLGNPYGAIEAQNQANNQNVLDQFQSNRPTATQNPYGRQDIGYDPATGAYQVSQTLDPQEQEKLDQNRRRDLQLGNAASGTLGSLPQQPFNLSGLPAGLDTNQLEKGRQAAQDSVTKRFAQVNDPIFQKQTSDLDQQLLNSGIPRDSELWNQQKGLLARQQQDARDSATAQGVQLGGAELQRNFDIGQQGRQSALQEQLTARGLPYDELSKILGARGEVVNPQFQGISNIDVPQNNIYQGTSGYLGAASSIYGQQVAGQQASDLARQQGEQQLRAIKAGGGGGGLSIADQLSLAQGRADIGTKSDIDRLNYEYTHNPAYQNKGPSTGSQIGGFLGGIGGAFGGALAQGAGQNLANSIFRPSLDSQVGNLVSGSGLY